MALMTGEQREQRALSQARKAAEAAEEEDRRREQRRQQWQREGTYMSRAEMEAGEPCRGCGQPLLDGAGDWPPLSQLTPEQRAEHDRADAEFRERHADCKAGSWSMSGHRTAHCSYCCPPPPLSARQIVQVGRILSGGVRREDLDAWDLTLTCDHVVRHTQHRDYRDRCSTSVTTCPACGRGRGVVTARRVGPADDPSGQVAQERLTAELAKAQAKLDKQRNAVKATERRIADLARELEEPGGEPA